MVNYELFNDYTITDGERSYKVTDLFYLAELFPRNYRTKWFLSVLPDITNKDILDIYGGYGEHGIYLQRNEKKVFNYTVVDAGIYGRKSKPNPTEHEWSKPIWSLQNKYDRVLINDCSIPETYGKLIEDCFERLDINGKFILYEVNRKTPLPFPEDNFDMVWLFGWWAWNIDIISLFDEVRRVLDMGGHFIFEMPKKSPEWLPLKCMHERELRWTIKETGFVIKRLDNMPLTPNVKHRHTFGVVCR